MDYENRMIRLYTAQTDEVVRIIDREGQYFVKQSFIAGKYGDVKDVFLEAYNWYVRQASLLVLKPEEAQSAVWTFTDIKYVEKYPGSRILKLAVPITQAVFFRMTDWNKILNLRYVGVSEQEELRYAQTLEKNGIQYEGDVYHTPYYPQIKQQLVASWNNLFRFDHGIKTGEPVGFPDMQAGLWCIRKEWVTSIE